MENSVPRATVRAESRLTAPQHGGRGEAEKAAVHAGGGDPIQRCHDVLAAMAELLASNAIRPRCGSSAASGGNGSDPQRRVRLRPSSASHHIDRCNIAHSNISFDDSFAAR